ncbi:HD domain-containing protein [Spongiactinospora sp. TRM90649]|uniref:HD domain-containing protein n=1 Tax=Spongiactinospora sp. TRM90649 TaxID=3031114 RepID=UPI0023F65A86|nr:HD domain-containing protein [Spongiactinospora sp. TRM90649]MDF5757567.1 HD domain-containing protein [Spongiactinospora sp. TRM90649]
MTSGIFQRREPPEAPASGPGMRLLMTVVEGLAVPPYHVARSTTVPFLPGRNENDAEHSFSLGLVGYCLAPLMDEPLDGGLIVRYALVHDLAEIYSGDVSVYADEAEREKKARREAQARAIIAAEYGETFPWLVRDLLEYHAQADPESRFVYALDKMLPHAMIILGDHHPLRPAWADYLRTERVARQKIGSSCPALLPLFEELCRAFADRPHLFADRPGPRAVPASSVAPGDHDGGDRDQPGPHDREQDADVQWEAGAEDGRQRDQERAERAGGDPRQDA